MVIEQQIAKKKCSAMQCFLQCTPINLFFQNYRWVKEGVPYISRQDEVTIGSPISFVFYSNQLFAHFSETSPGSPGKGS